MAAMETMQAMATMKTMMAGGGSRTLTKEVKTMGLFTIPGLCRITSRVKRATKVSVRIVFSQEIKDEAQPARR